MFLSQASMDTFNKWFAGLVEILKTVSHEPSYTEFKGKLVHDSFFFAQFGRRNAQQCLHFFFY